MSLLRHAAKAVFATADRFLPSPEGPRILIYHQVEAGLGRQMEVTTDDFIWQLDWLAQNREVVSLDEALERWEEPGSENLVVLTIDDGYRDTFTIAFPLLKERGLPFTLYLTTGFVGIEQHLTWDQIGQMVSTGLITVGAHTHGHLDLRHATAGQIEEEFEASNSLIVEHTEMSPRHFAYPWGYWSSTADPVVRRHYETAVLGASSRRRPASSGFDRHCIHRYPVQRGDARWFKARLDGGLVLEENVRRRVRGYRGP